MAKPVSWLAGSRLLSAPSRPQRTVAVVRISYLLTVARAASASHRTSRAPGHGRKVDIIADTRRRCGCRHGNGAWKRFAAVGVTQCQRSILRNARPARVAEAALAKYLQPSSATVRRSIRSPRRPAAPAPARRRRSRPASRGSSAWDLRWSDLLDQPPAEADLDEFADLGGRPGSVLGYRYRPPLRGTPTASLLACSPTVRSATQAGSVH